MSLAIPTSETMTAPALTTTLQVQNLNFFYGQFQGLKDINLDIFEKKSHRVHWTFRLR